MATPGTASGHTSVLNSVVFYKSSRRVPARVGVQFGVRYRITGVPSGQEATIRTKWLVPAPGMRNPLTGKVTRVDEADETVVTGTDRLAGYKFSQAWEVVPGRWTLELWSDDRKLGSVDLHRGQRLRPFNRGRHERRLRTAQLRRHPGRHRREARHRGRRLPGGLHRSAISAGWRAAGRARAREHREAAQGRAPARRAGGGVQHRLPQRARDALLEDHRGARDLPAQPSQHQARPAHLRARLRPARCDQEGSVDLLRDRRRELFHQGAGRHGDRHRLQHLGLHPRHRARQLQPALPHAGARGLRRRHRGAAASRQPA